MGRCCCGWGVQFYMGVFALVLGWAVGFGLGCSVVVLVFFCNWDMPLRGSVFAVGFLMLARVLCLCDGFCSINGSKLLVCGCFLLIIRGLCPPPPMAHRLDGMSSGEFFLGCRGVLYIEVGVGDRYSLLQKQYQWWACGLAMVGCFAPKI
ncbi:hypothetical protein U1Q18_015637 [Sarracenia purpurea var. burkii]